MKGSLGILMIVMILGGVKTALKEKVFLISKADTNLDTYDSLDYSNSILRDMRDEYVDQSNIAIMNNEFIHFFVHNKNSCIDHITTNCPDNLSYTIIIPQVNLDHSGLETIFKSKKLLIHSK